MNAQCWCQSICTVVKLSAAEEAEEVFLLEIWNLVLAPPSQQKLWKSYFGDV